MVEKSLLLQLLDQTWKEHLLHLDHLRQGIGLRAYGQRDPLNEYKREAFNMFEAMLDHLRERVTGVLMHVELRVDQPIEEPQRPPQRMQETRQDPALVGAGDAAEANAATGPERPAASGPKVPRNAPCPCGSGKKYKHCHGQLA